MAKWRHMASDILVIIGSGNDLAPNKSQAITWTNAELVSVRPYETYFNEIIFLNWKVFIKENGFENVICKMWSILFTL